METEKTRGGESEESERRKLILLEKVKECLSQRQDQRREESPLVWAMEVVKCLKSLKMKMPSPDLAEILVSHLCFDNNNASIWKFLQQALSSRLLSPLHVLSLLSSRVIPNRRSQPEAYRLFLELFSRYAFSLDTAVDDACRDKIINSADAALQLSRTYEVRLSELGQLLVLFFFTVFVGLIDSTFDDMGLQIKSSDIQEGPFGTDNFQDMDMDSRGDYSVERNEHRELLRKKNTIMAMEVLAKLMESRKAVVLLRLVHFNMYDTFPFLIYFATE